MITKTFGLRNCPISDYIEVSLSNNSKVKIVVIDKYTQEIRVGKVLDLPLSEKDISDIVGTPFAKDIKEYIDEVQSVFSKKVIAESNNLDV